MAAADADTLLPDSIRSKAVLSGKELAWRRADIFEALQGAQSVGLASLGGQVQFLFPDGTCELYWLNYDPDERRPQEQWGEFVLRTHGETVDRLRRMLETTDIVRAVAVSRKNPEFEPENEWRVTWLREVDGDLPVLLRSVASELVAYVEMPLPIEAIRRIVVGTKRDVRRTAGSLMAFLHGQGIYHVDVDECRIPFR